MIFNFFHLMPYPYLPDNFDDYPSPSLRFPNKFFDREKGTKLYDRYIGELEYADKLGFDGICVNEHHQTAYGIMPSPNIIAASLARRTFNAKIMILGNAIGLRDHPLRVAEEVAMIDHLSNGRVVSGFVRGIGWEYYGHSISPTKSRDRFNEAHDLIIKAWTSEEPFEFVSDNYEFRYVNVWPRPVQQPHPPVFIPGTGSSETWRFVAEHGYTYLGVYAPTKIVKSWFDGFRRAGEQLEIETPPERIAFTTPIYVAETDERAMEEARPHLEWLFHKGLKQGPELVFPPGYLTQGSLRGVLGSGMKPYNETSWEELVAGGYFIVGSPSTVAERLEEMRQTLGFGQICCLMCIGDMPHHRVVKSMDLFANEVMPKFRERSGAEPALAAAGD
jgi:alkanesulfonate monooxygenase SsuD/methylene tetrahydromethanopterin reductase-like flavin-dependent oxidoreductase (luciferase family)